jgi:hypothetical protein
MDQAHHPCIDVDERLAVGLQRLGQGSFDLLR